MRDRKLKLTIHYPTEIPFQWFQFDTEPEPNYVWLNPETGELGAGTYAGTSSEFAHGTVRRYRVDAVISVEAWREMLNAIAPLARRVIRGWAPDGSLTEDAERADSEIEGVIERVLDSYDPIPIFQAADWYQGDPPHITADTTDAELERIIRSETARAQEEDGGVIVVGLEDYLRGLREAALREQAELQAEMDAEENV